MIPKKVVDFDKYCHMCTHEFLDEVLDPCTECLEVPVREESSTPINFKQSETYNPKHPYGYFDKITKIHDYLYELTYEKDGLRDNRFDYGFASRYFTQRRDYDLGSCSSVRSGKWYGRNFDWTYDESVEFIIRNKATLKSYPSIGIAGGIPNIKLNEFDELYLILPFLTRDAMNSQGVVASMNVVPKDESVVTDAFYVGDDHLTIKKELCALMLVRFIVDNFSSAKKACEWLNKYALVYFPVSLHQRDYEIHLMVADSQGTYAIEFINGLIKIIDISNKPFLTNFHIYGVHFNLSGTVKTPKTSDKKRNPVTVNNITPHGSGLERYNYLVRHYNDISNKEDMLRVLNDLKYTRAYSTSERPSNPYWFSEFVGGVLTLESDLSEYSSIVTAAGDLYLNRERDGKTWHTVHSSIYDMDSKTLYLRTQEDDTEYEFKLEV